MVNGANVRLIAPYAAWMILMAALPQTLAAYAVRTLVTAALLIPTLRLGSGDFVRAVRGGLLPGVLVLLVWVLPEQFGWDWYARWFMMGDGGLGAQAPACATTADRALVAVRLVGSAFVISAAEELFFRKWLIGFAGFGWMVALFAIEHDRWLVGAIAGAVYGLVYLRRGLGAAIVAHATTNLLLGLWVLHSGQWQFW